MRQRYTRTGRAIYRDKRWPALRLAAKRRDGWHCVQCGHKKKLEVDHVRPVRDHPELAFDLDNLQVLCGACHGKKTRIDIGLDPLHPERAKWRALLKMT